MVVGPDSDWQDSGISPSVWRYARASRACVVVDAAAYFGLMQTAMLGARRRIMLLGWDFDTRVQLSGGAGIICRIGRVIRRVWAALWCGW